MQEWQKRLNHERNCRDALILCGNEGPEEPDPHNGVRPVKTVMKFNGKVFFGHLSNVGCSSAQYVLCKCRKAG